MARPNPNTKHYCGTCGIFTNEYLLWADGRATWPGCPRHKKEIEKQIRIDNGKWACVIGWKKYAR